MNTSKPRWLLIAAALFFFVVAQTPDQLFARVSFINKWSRDGAVVVALIASSIFLLTFQIKNGFLRLSFILFLFYLGLLFGESKMKYDTWLIYPHVLLDLMGFVYIVAYYVIARRFVSPYDLIKLICWLTTLFSYVGEAYSRMTGSMVDDSLNRALYSQEVYLLMFATIFFVIDYFEKGNSSLLWIILMNLVIIIIENHRSIWMSGGVSFVVLSIMLFARFQKNEIKSRKILLMLMVGIWLIVGFVIAGMHSGGNLDQYVTKMTKRLEEIWRFKEGGTPQWRYNALRYYSPYIREHLWFGMRYEGFEVAPLYDKEFPGQSGHHFHSEYLAATFYHGIIGLFFLIFPSVYITWRMFIDRRRSMIRAGLLSFAISGFFYASAYVLPFYYYALLGIAFAFQETEDEDAMISNTFGNEEPDSIR